MPYIKLGISFPSELVAEIDRLSRGLQKSRSEIIRDAIVKMLGEYKKQRAAEKAVKIYKEIAEDDKRLAEDFLSICAEPAAKYTGRRKIRRK